MAIGAYSKLGGYEIDVTAQMVEKYRDRRKSAALSHPRFSGIAMAAELSRRELVQWVYDRRRRRLERERRDRLWRRADENRALGQAREKREGEREALLQEMVDCRVRAERLRGWIASTGEPSAPETTRMLDCARRRLVEIEHGLDPHSFAELLRGRRLFPDVDPLAPLPKDPDL